MTQLRAISQRPTSPVNTRLDKRLTAYVAAASAAGIGMLAAPQVAEAKVVYTPANVSIGVGGSIPIDLNNDGTQDFIVFGRACGFRGNCLYVDPSVTGNGIRGSNVRASAGIYGLPAGPKVPFLSKFATESGQSFVGFMAFVSEYHSGVNSAGPWADTTNKYLGFKFLINGEFHYGWARMSVKMRKNSIVLTGYAYETIPNHRIFEGYTQGLETSDVRPTEVPVPQPQPATLGLLARGTDGLTIWRRDDEALAPRQYSS
jgi:hypothetical protein